MKLPMLFKQKPALPMPTYGLDWDDESKEFTLDIVTYIPSGVFYKAVMSGLGKVKSSSKLGESIIFNAQALAYGKKVFKKTIEGCLKQSDLASSQYNCVSGSAKKKREFYEVKLRVIGVVL